MRDEFREIVSSWTLLDGPDGLLDRIKRVEEYEQPHYPLEEDERDLLRVRWSNL